MNDALLWSARAYIYERFAATAQAPSAADIAQRFSLTTPAAESLLRALHERHALFLQPGTVTIRMASPFSAVETSYEVLAAGQTYWANCAWDTFGVAAALHTPEAEIRAVCAHTGAPIRLRITAGAVHSAGQVVHYQVPFAHWYDDLLTT